MAGARAQANLLTVSPVSIKISALAHVDEKRTLFYCPPSQSVSQPRTWFNTWRMSPAHTGA